ncbi:hypothetical protein UK12_34625, partial [Saccharothrix sp. ST-888]
MSLVYDDRFAMTANGSDAEVPATTDSTEIADAVAAVDVVEDTEPVEAAEARHEREPADATITSGDLELH